MTYNDDPAAFIDGLRKLADAHNRENFDRQAQLMRADGVPDDAIEAARALSLAHWPEDRERGLAGIVANIVGEGDRE